MSAVNGNEVPGMGQMMEKGSGGGAGIRKDKEALRRKESRKEFTG